MEMQQIRYFLAVADACTIEPALMVRRGLYKVEH